MTKIAAVKLTLREVQMVQHALTISFEDGSIYGYANEGEESREVERLGENIHKKLRRARIRLTP